MEFNELEIFGRLVSFDFNFVILDQRFSTCVRLPSSVPRGMIRRGVEIAMEILIHFNNLKV